jgi:preprotein translocase subunit SecD
MLQFSFSKKFLIWAVCVIGILMAVPNGFYTTVEQSNDAEIALEAGMPATAELTAQAESWPAWMPSSLVNLGLDLRGGAHLLAEVQVEEVYAERIGSYWPQVRDALREERAVVGGVRQQDSADHELRVRIAKPEAMDVALAKVRALASPVQSLSGVIETDIDVRAEGADIIITLSEAERLATDQRTMEQSLEVVRRRIDAAGTREPTIQRQGDRRILIQVPGIGSAEELKILIGKTARLTFHPV